MEKKQIIKWLEAVIKRAKSRKPKMNPATNHVLCKDGFFFVTCSHTLLRVHTNVLGEYADGYYEIFGGKLIRIPDSDTEAQGFRFPDYTRVLNRNNHSHMLSACTPIISGTMSVVIPTYPGDGWLIGSHSYAPCIQAHYLPPCDETRWDIEIERTHANAYPIFFSSLGILYAVMPIDTTKTITPWNVTYTQEGIEWAAAKLTQQEEQS